LVFALASNVDRPVIAKTAFPESIRLVLVSPSVAVPTHQARAALPGSYERADVVHTLQRTALLAAACFSGRFEFFPELFDDRLHQPYRKKLVPGIESCLRLRHEGLLGTVISGSGSTVMAFVDHGKEAEGIAAALQECFAKEGIESEARFTAADNQGAFVTRGGADPADRQRQVFEKAERAQ
jgi:homoserine kinase